MSKHQIHQCVTAVLFKLGKMFLHSGLSKQGETMNSSSFQLAKTKVVFEKPSCGQPKPLLSRDCIAGYKPFLFASHLFGADDFLKNSFHCLTSDLPSMVFQHFLGMQRAANHPPFFVFYRHTFCKCMSNFNYLTFNFGSKLKYLRESNAEPKQNAY